MALIKLFMSVGIATRAMWKIDSQHINLEYIVRSYLGRNNCIKRPLLRLNENGR